MTANKNIAAVLEYFGILQDDTKYDEHFNRVKELLADDVAPVENAHNVGEPEENAN